MKKKIKEPNIIGFAAITQSQYVISIKDNPAFATKDDDVKVESIIINRSNIVKTQKRFLLFFKKYKNEVVNYKKEINISDLTDGDVILVYEMDYPDRFFYKGIFCALALKNTEDELNKALRSGGRK